jgi:hypothetical protein
MILTDEVLARIYDDVTCPFCQETGFDLEGLEMHIYQDRCEVYGASHLAEKERAEKAELRNRELTDALEQLADDKGSSYWTSKEVMTIARKALERGRG